MKPCLELAGKWGLEFLLVSRGALCVQGFPTPARLVKQPQSPREQRQVCALGQEAALGLCDAGQVTGMFGSHCHGRWSRRSMVPAVGWTHGTDLCYWH